MATIEELQQQVAALSAQVAAITAPPTDYYTSQYDGEEIDAAVARAAVGGAVDLSLSAKLDWECLINPEFTVAQAGIGGNHGSVPYAADCWKLVSGAVSAAPGGGLVLNGVIRQTLETAVGLDVVASINVTSGTATASYDDATRQFDITSSGGTIKRAHLGLIAITDWSKIPPSDFGEELRKCQRYFFRMKSSGSYGSFGLCAAVSTTTGYMAIALPTIMRTVPSIVQSGAITVFGWVNAVSLSVGYMVGNALTVSVAPTGPETFAVNGAYETFINNDSSAFVDFISDL